MKQIRSRNSARGVSLGVALVLIGLASAPHADAATRARAAASKAKRAVPDSAQVLVRIGKEAITRGDVQRRIDALPEQFRSNYGTPEGRQQILDRMVEERVWLSLANKNGVANRPQVKEQLDQQRRDLIVRTYLNEVMAENPAPSDSEAHVYYETHVADYTVPGTVTVSHIQSKSEADAKRVRQAAKGKQDWSALVKRFSTDSLTRTKGGSLGTVTREGAFSTLGAQPALAESAFALSEGQISGPIKTAKGWHIIKVESIKAESVRPFDQVKPVITRQLTSKHSQDYYKTRLDDAKRKLSVTPDSSAIKRFISAKKGARDLFNEAQAITSPEARVEAYRKLLAQYPDSEVSPQAQFMIGFIYSEELKNYDEADKSFRELLRNYPKAELAASAQWMIDHMRSDEAPSFINLDPDSAKSTSKRRKGAVRAATRPTSPEPTQKPKGASRNP